jgi:hypothetical protein
MTMKNKSTSRQMSIIKKTGNAGEQHAAGALRRLGILMVEEVGTPFVIISRKPGGWVKGFWKAKVSGDLRGHTAQGISVLAEVKTAWDRNLHWSDLDTHQPERLSMHAECAISLLVWVHRTGIFCMRWPVPGFGPGVGITPELGQALSLETL